MSLYINGEYYGEVKKYEKSYGRNFKDNGHRFLMMNHITIVVPFGTTRKFRLNGRDSYEVDTFW